MEASEPDGAGDEGESAGVLVQWLSCVMGQRTMHCMRGRRPSPPLSLPNPSPSLPSLPNASPLK